MNDGYDLVRELSGDDVFRPSIFPGLEVAVAALWKR